MKLKRKYTLAWVFWFAWFAVVEWFAVRNPEKGDTLSEHGWAWGSFKERGRAWRWRRLFFLVLLVWLAAHILSGGFF